MAFSLSELWSRLFGGRQSSNRLFARASGSRILLSAETALNVTAFLRAARVVAEGMGAMPLKLYLEGSDAEGRATREVARKHKSYKTICYMPCWLTKTEFIETMTMHAFVTGDAFAIINRGGGPASDPVLELLPLMPGDCTFSVNKDWEPEYRVAMAGFAEIFTAGQILHIRGPSWDGRIGMNIVEKAREALGLSVALEQTHASLMGTDARPAGILTTAGAVSPEAANLMRERWRDAYGPGGTKGVAILDNGFDFKSIQMNAVDAQYIENRRFQIEEIARATGVFPQMLMHVDKTATFASSSEFFAAHVKYTMLPWTNRWEEALKRDAIGWEGKNTDVWARFSMDVLLRANPGERGAFYTSMFNIGVYSSNDIREIENLNPREGGDEYLTPLNMGSGAGDPAKPPADPTASPPVPPPPPPKDPAK